jgi:hypothetical protein
MGTAGSTTSPVAARYFVASLLIVSLLWACSAAVPYDGDRVVATVNDDAITVTALEDYEAVFEAPDGARQISREDALVSLVNQAIVLQEMDRRRIDITNEEIEARVVAVEGFDSSDSSDPSNAAALRRHMRALIAFQKLKPLVVGGVEIPEADLLERYQRDRHLYAGTFPEAAAAIYETIETERVEALWSGWLAKQRACARIVVADPSIGLRSSTPSPACS